MPRALLKRWLTRRPRLTVDTAQVPDGMRIYAVGDVHGRVDLLRCLHEIIAADAATAPYAARKVIVYLGDYIDRGFDSRAVIDVLLDEPLPGFDSVHLRGNHDEEFVCFLEDPVRSAAWLRYGGDATLYSYGVRLPDALTVEESTELRVVTLRDQLRERVPVRHIDFFASLPLAYEIGDFLFVHAGVDPDKPLDAQTPADMLWIRDPFLESDDDFGKIVVHGHSICDYPEVRDNRIGIDTGACYTNALTCLVLQGSERYFLSTRALDV
ncbi:MAG: serine/threonine protein phosphatase [Rhodospirillales bacterium]|nr:serine/threonine protein phosphatase [Rhodospirillales bacterium]